MVELLSGLSVNIALLHHPVLNRRHEVVTTAVTNVDIHDIARTARTYGVDRVFLVTPVAAQQALVQRIRDHWTWGEGASYNPRRREALTLLEIAASFDEVVERLTAGHGRRPVIVGTSAREAPGSVGFADMRARLRAMQGALLIVLGTGWGLTDEVMSRVDLRLEPIRGASEWNHLSVRSAAAILIDRLFGDACGEPYSEEVRS